MKTNLLVLIITLSSILSCKENKAPLMSKVSNVKIYEKVDQIPKLKGIYCQHLGNERGLRIHFDENSKIKGGFALGLVENETIELACNFKAKQSLSGKRRMVMYRAEQVAITAGIIECQTKEKKIAVKGTIHFPIYARFHRVWEGFIDPVADEKGVAFLKTTHGTEPLLCTAIE